VPEQSTDFIFSVIGEEFGFIGGMLVLFLFALLLIRMLVIGAHIKHSFAMMTSVGVASVYLIHIFINIGMATGILPVIGIPLPFISYGGTALLAHSLMLGLVLNIEAHKDEFSIYGY
jgi:rod shape determining protein RodA